MGDKIPAGQTGSEYNNQILGTDEEGYVRKVRVDGDGELQIEPVSDYFHKIALGEIENHSSIYKFGRNPSVGATEVIVSSGGYYGMPSTAQPIVITSTSVDDNPTGIGARTIEIIGLNQLGMKYLKLYR